MSQLLNPNDFVITRRRKKYKFAKFANAANCFEFDEWKTRARAPAIDIVEIGAGTGLFSVELAARHPDKTFVAMDVKGDRLQKGAYVAMERGVDNIYFVRARADQIEEMFASGSIENIWLTFSDPFPKERSAGRRLTHLFYLAKYRQLLSRKGSLLIKHDDDAFFAWSLEQLVADGWRIDELSFDLHESGLDDDYKVLTNYEQRWLDSGLKTKFVRAVLQNR